MLKQILPLIWVYDCEWVPDARVGRKLYGLDEDCPEKDVFEKMWQEGGADEDNPRPYLKTVLCRIVSISVLSRTKLPGKDKDGNDVSLALHTLPTEVDSNNPCAEKDIIAPFLQSLGKQEPQLVGYNSYRADLWAIVQRALANNIQAKEFCKRANSPWQGRDYFNTNSSWQADLLNSVSSFGRGTPSLNDLAVACSFPGKIETSGAQVPELWLEGRYQEIVDYNECDSVVTYLLWLRISYFTGLISEDAYKREQLLLEQLLEKEAEAGKKHLGEYLELWKSMR